MGVLGTGHANSCTVSGETTRVRGFSLTVYFTVKTLIKIYYTKNYRAGMEKSNELMDGQRTSERTIYTC